MVNKVVTVGEGESAYQTQMDVEEAESTDTGAERLPREEANKMTKAELVDHVALPESDEDEGGEG